MYESLINLVDKFYVDRNFSKGISGAEPVLNVNYESINVILEKIKHIQAKAEEIKAKKVRINGIIASIEKRFKECPMTIMDIFIEDLHIDEPKIKMVVKLIGKTKWSDRIESKWTNKYSDFLGKPVILVNSAGGRNDSCRI